MGILFWHRLRIITQGLKAVNKQLLNKKMNLIITTQNLQLPKIKIFLVQVKYMPIP